MKNKVPYNYQKQTKKSTFYEPREGGNMDKNLSGIVFYSFFYFNVYMHMFIYFCMHMYMLTSVCVYVYVQVLHMYMYLQTLCLKTSMYEYPYIDYIVSHVHIAKDKIRKKILIHCSLQL